MQGFSESFVDEKEAVLVREGVVLVKSRSGVYKERERERESGVGEDIYKVQG